MQTYNDYFNNVLDYELNQEPAYGDLSAADDYRKLRFEDGKRYVNEAIDEFVQINPSFFEREFTYIFDSKTSEFIVPDYIQKIYSMKLNDSWSAIPDSSDLVATIKSPAYNIITNDDSWERGDSLVMKVVQYPDRIINDDDLVYFPRGHMRLLTLAVKKKAYSRLGNSLLNIEFSEYMSLLARFQNDIGRVQQVAKLARKPK